MDDDANSSVQSREFKNALFSSPYRSLREVKWRMESVECSLSIKRSGGRRIRRERRRGGLMLFSSGSTSSLLF